MGDPDTDIPTDEQDTSQLFAQFMPLVSYMSAEMWLVCTQTSIYVCQCEHVWPWYWCQQLFAQFLLLGCLSMLTGAAAMLLLGLLVYCRLDSDHSLKDCITNKTYVVAVASLAGSLLLLTQAPALPWDWLGTLVLMVLTAPALLTLLEHVEERRHASVGQIGKFSAYSHLYGYLRLMQGQHGTRKRLKAFIQENKPGFNDDKKRFHSNSVVVLVPTDGVYPTNWNDLKGIVGEKVGEVPAFQLTVGGNKRTYATFPVHEVTSSDGKDKKYVALDKVGALQTLQKLNRFGPAGFTVADCREQMTELIDELEDIINDTEFLRGELKVVRYKREDHMHVGDIILAALQD